MKAKYDFRVLPDMQCTNVEKILYPKLVTSGTKTLKDIMHHAARHSGLNEATVIGVVTYLEDVLAEYLAEGYNVKLGEIGTFSASLKSRKIKDKSEIRSQSVHFDNVNFKASKKLRSEITQKMKLEPSSKTELMKYMLTPLLMINQTSLNLCNTLKTVLENMKIS